MLISEYKMCGVAGMACLSQYTAKIIQYNECNCLPQCIDSFYEMASDKKLKW